MSGFTFDKIVLFGDSITQGSAQTLNEFNFVGALQHRYVRKLDVLNRGFSGYNTEWDKYILPKILEAETSSISKIKLVTIFLGTNDARETFQRVPIDKYESNLREMVDVVVSKNVNVIVVGPALYDHKLVPETGIASNSRNIEYSNAARKVAESFKVPFLDLWEAFRATTKYTKEEILTENCDFGKLLVDGIHFSGYGYKVFYDELVKVIDEKFPDLSPDVMPERLARYDEIDPNNVEKSIFKNE